MNRTVYNQKGEKTGETTIPSEIFGLEITHDLLHQAVRSYQANQRQGTAHTKQRDEVSGGGRKPWIQKGTGRARHGSIRSPLWIGGGTTFGPRKEKNYKLKFPKKMRRKALFMALSSKAEDRELFVIDKLDIEGKTKEMAEVLQGLREIKGFGDESILLVIDHSKEKDHIVRAGRNIDGLEVHPAHNLNAYKVLKSKYFVVTESALERIKDTFI